MAKWWKSEKKKIPRYVLYPILVINAQRKFQLSKIMILPWVTVTSDDSNSSINWNINSWSVGYNYILQMTHLFCDDNMQPKTLNTLNSSEFLLWAYTLWRCFKIYCGQILIDFFHRSGTGKHLNFGKCFSYTVVLFFL